MSGIVRTDNLKATKVGRILSMVHESVEMENGFLVNKGDLKDDEREVYEVIRENRDINPVFLVAHPEWNYEEYKRTDNALEEFSIPAGMIFRAYELVPYDRYSVSLGLVDFDSSDEEDDIGKYVVQSDNYDGKHEVVTEEYLADIDAVFVGKIKAIETVGTTVPAGASITRNTPVSADVGRENDMVVIEVMRNAPLPHMGS